MTDVGSENANLPAHEIVYRQMREMVLFGELAPGQAVTIQGLVATLKTGMTPVREAIRRLTAERALLATGNRRVCVPQLDKSQLAQLSFVRDTIEPALAERAMPNLTPRQIAAIEDIDHALETAIAAGDVKGYLRHNYRFHRAIYLAADAPILASIADDLWLRVGPSLRVVCGRFGTLNLPDMHEEAITAMRAGDAVGVAQAIRADIAQGHATILRTLEDA
mgnify:CR=1 FL=1